MQGIRRARSLLGVLNVNILQVCKFTSIVILVILVAVVAVNVYCRYVLNSSLSWSEDVSKILLLWLVFIAAPITLRLGELISIDFLTERLPAKLRNIVLLVSTLLVLAFCLIMTWQGWLFAVNGWRQVHVTVGFSMFWVFLAIPVGCLLMTFAALEMLLERIEKVIDPEIVFENPRLESLRAMLHGYGDVE